MFENYVKVSDEILNINRTIYDNPMGLPTGIYPLDNMIRGLQPGLTIVAGRPSMGKSSLMIDMSLAIGKENTAILFSMEMSRRICMERMIANQANVSYTAIKSNLISDIQKQKVEDAANVISKMSIIIDDSSLLTVNQIQEKMNKYTELFSPDVVMVDYLQLMTAVTASTRQQEITEICRVLAALAKTYALPFVVLCQLNRSVEYRENHRPRLSDLRESGSIEQDADVVLLLHRPGYYTVLDNPLAVDNGSAEIIIAKQRNGSTGIVNCNWSAQTMSFRDNVVGEDF
jgi:replicative DNA helicase